MPIVLQIVAWHYLRWSWFIFTNVLLIVLYRPQCQAGSIHDSNDCILTCSQHEDCMSKTCCHAHGHHSTDKHNHHSHHHGDNCTHSDSHCSDSVSNHELPPSLPCEDVTNNLNAEAIDETQLTIVTSGDRVSPECCVDVDESQTFSKDNDNTDKMIISQIVSSV